MKAVPLQVLAPPTRIAVVRTRRRRHRRPPLRARARAPHRLAFFAGGAVAARVVRLDWCGSCCPHAGRFRHHRIAAVDRACLHLRGGVHAAVHRGLHVHRRSALAEVPPPPAERLSWPLGCTSPASCWSWPAPLPPGTRGIRRSAACDRMDRNRHGLMRARAVEPGRLTGCMRAACCVLDCRHRRGPAFRRRPGTHHFASGRLPLAARCSRASARSPLPSRTAYCPSSPPMPSPPGAVAAELGTGAAVAGIICSAFFKSRAGSIRQRTVPGMADARRRCADQSALIALAIRWGLVQSLRGPSLRLVAMLHVAFVWIPLALALAAIDAALGCWGGRSETRD